MPVPSNSRFKFTSLQQAVTRDGITVETYGLWTRPSFLNDPHLAYTNFVVPNSLSGRVDSISQQVYGTTEYFWVIIAFNNPIDPLNWPKTGDVIKIPNLAAIASAM